MIREEALNSIKANVSNKSLVKRMLAAEAVMRALAKRFGEDEEEWGLSGLLHDIDMELTEGDIHSHSRLGADLVREMGASEAMAHAILCHNPAHGVPLETRLDKALFCAAPLAGLITAVAQIGPDKKLAGLEAEAVMKKFQQKDVDRQQISRCSDLGLGLEEFVKLGLTVMKGIAGELGL